MKTINEMVIDLFELQIACYCKYNLTMASKRPIRVLYSITCSTNTHKWKINNFKCFCLELLMLRFSLGVTGIDRIRNEYIRGIMHVRRFGEKVSKGQTEMVWTCTKEG